MPDLSYRDFKKQSAAAKLLQKLARGKLARKAAPKGKASAKSVQKL